MAAFLAVALLALLLRFFSNLASLASRRAQVILVGDGMMYYAPLVLQITAGKWRVLDRGGVGQILDTPYQVKYPNS